MVKPYMPLISIIVPVYNVERYLDQCLNSLITQTYKNVEIIVVNDGSSDGSHFLIERYRKLDDRVKVLVKDNGGLSSARNAGLDIASGEWIVFIDSDDYAKPQMVERLLDACLTNDVRLGFCAIDCFDIFHTDYQSSFHAREKLVFRSHGKVLDLSKKDSLIYLFPSAWNKIYDKSLFDDVRYDEGIYYEDHHVFYKVFSKVDSAAYVDEALYMHRIDRPDRITKTVSPKIFDIFAVLNDVESVLRQNLSVSQLKKALATISIRLVWERSFVVNGTKFESDFFLRARSLPILRTSTIVGLLRNKDKFISAAFVLKLKYPFLFSLLRKGKSSIKGIFERQTEVSPLPPAAHVQTSNSPEIENLRKKVYNLAAVSRGLLLQNILNVESQDDAMKARSTLIRLLKTSYSKNIEGNWDYRRFGRRETEIDVDYSLESIAYVVSSWSDLEYSYSRFSDAYSRDSYIRFHAYRILGHRYVQLPVASTDFFKDEYEKIESYLLETAIEAPSFNYLPVPSIIKKFDTSSKSSLSSVSTSEMSFFEVFILKQYEYTEGPVEIGVREGDIVVDAGACWGETSLYFASKAGQQGKVYAFEISSQNRDIFQRNLISNPEFAGLIEIVDKAISDKSDEEFGLIDCGQASKLVPHGKGLFTISIDDFCKRKGLNKIDFIKFDIEGAERLAISGAAETIKTLRPKLAISVYHLTDDIEFIMRQVTSIDPEYDFYLRGVCMNHAETILFCVPKLEASRQPIIDQGL